MTRNNLIIALLALSLLGFQVHAAKQMPTMDHGRMRMDMSGRMVMGQNTDQLPSGCRKVSEDVKITVHAGHQYAKPYPGTMFGYSEHQWKVQPCARMTVTLVNDDDVRHQWMLHDLPEDLYPRGMFHLEVTGPGEVTGTFIVPPFHKTYLVHCDITQHTEKGMKAQLIVGRGSGVLPGIPGISDVVAAPGEGGAAAGEASLLSGMLILGMVAAILGTPYLLRWTGRRFFGMSGRELNAYLFERLMTLFCLLVRGFADLWGRLRPRRI